MPVTQMMSPRDFKDFIRALTRAKVLVTDTVFLMKNDIMIPKKRTVWNRPGKHYVKGFVVESEPYSQMTYEFDSNVLLEAVKGQKGKLAPVIISINEKHIDFSIHYGNNNILVTPGKAIPAEKFPEDHSNFDEIIGEVTWKDFTMEELQSIKEKQPLELISKEGAVARISRDLFKLAGVEQAKNAIKYTGRYGFEGSPEKGMMMLYINMQYEFGQCLHVYPFAIYKPCGDHTYEEL